MPSSKEFSRRQFLSGLAGCGTALPDCFLGRDRRELTADVSLMLSGAGGGVAVATGRLILSETKEITRRELLKIANGGLVGTAAGLVLGESLRWQERRREENAILSLFPPAPAENKELTELSLPELAALIDDLEGRVPTPEEADVLLTATVYQAARFLGESPAKAREYVQRLSQISGEASFSSICQQKVGENLSACVTVCSGGELFAFFDSSQKEWQSLSDTGIPIRSWVRVIAHEVAHMNVSRVEVFPGACARPKEDYGILGNLEVFDRRGFNRNLIGLESQDFTTDGSLEEEFFAEWAAFRFSIELEKVGLEKKQFISIEPKFSQAIFNLELSDSNWPEWWRGALDFNRVAKLHWDNNLWRFRREIGEAMLSYMYPLANFGEGDKAALGKLAFEAFAKTDMEKLNNLLWIESKEQMLDL